MGVRVRYTCRMGIGFVRNATNTILRDVSSVMVVVLKRRSLLNLCTGRRVVKKRIGTKEIGDVPNATKTTLHAAVLVSAVMYLERRVKI